MKKTLLMLAAMWALASECHAGTNLIISGIDGSSQIISLSDKPKVTIEADKLSVTTPATTIEFDLQKVKDFKFIDSAGIDAPAASNGISIDGDIVTISPEGNDIRVDIINLNGIIFKSKSVESGHTDTMSISDLEKGVYIISTPQQAFKIIKR